MFSWFWDTLSYFGTIRRSGLFLPCICSFCLPVSRRLRSTHAFFFFACCSAVTNVRFAVIVVSLTFFAHAKNKTTTTTPAVELLACFSFGLCRRIPCVARVNTSSMLHALGSCIPWGSGRSFWFFWFLLVSYRNCCMPSTD
jgi:hypothetical protein